MLGAERQAAVQVGRALLGIKRDGAGEVRDRQVPIGPAEEGGAAIDIGSGHGGIKTNGFCEVSNRALQIPLREVVIAARHVGMSIARVQLDRSVKLIQGLRGLTGRLKAEPEIQM